MPKGVYERRSAQQKTAGKGKGKGKAKANAKASPKVASQAVAAPTAAAPVQPVAAAPTAAPAAQTAPQFSRDDFRKPIDDMEGPLLRAYARHIGVMQRDVDGLTQDRLRQNCKALLLEQLED